MRRSLNTLVNHEFIWKLVSSFLSGHVDIQIHCLKWVIHSQQVNQLRILSALIDNTLNEHLRFSEELVDSLCICEHAVLIFVPVAYKFQRQTNKFAKFLQWK